MALFRVGTDFLEIVQNPVKCNRCKQQKICGEFDNSGTEYGPLVICLDCIISLFSEAQDNPNKWEFADFS